MIERKKCPFCEKVLDKTIKEYKNGDILTIKRCIDCSYEISETESNEVTK